MNPVSIIMLSIGLAGIILYLARLLDDWYKNKLTKRNMEKLPDKWGIKTTKETLDVLEKWRLSQPKADKSLPLLEKSILTNQRRIDNSYCYYTQNWPSYDNIVEIFFEDFKRLVLKESTSDKPKEPELIVGNWYECLITRYPDQKWLFKYQDNYLFKTMSSIGIEVNSKHKIKGRKIDENKNVHSIKPANMEEVYSYFPEERPKSNIPEINKYITVTCEKYGKGVMIGLVLTNKKEWGSEHLGGHATFLSTFNDEKLFNCDKEWSFYKKNEGRNWRISTEDEIKWLDACIKANKFVPKEEALKIEEKWIPKVGDWATSKDYSDNFDGGVAYKITKINEDQIYAIGKFGKEAQKSEYCWKKSTPEEIAKVTGKKEEPMNTYGLKVGDKLPYKILEAWERVGNLHYKPNNKIWVEGSYGFGTDRQIEAFKILDNHTGFRPSGCHEELFLKAEGFKEFMDNFDKPDFVKPKSLVGRWVKRISSKTYPAYLSVKVGEYDQITEDAPFLWLKTFKSIEKNDLGREFELMPEGFIPPNKELSKEELLEEAKRRYPIGTVVKTPDRKEIATVREFSQSEGDSGWYSSEHIIVWSKENTYSGIYLYFNGKWAEIVSKPERIFFTGTWSSEKYKTESHNPQQLPKQTTKQTGKSGHQKPIVLKQTKTNFKLLTKNKL